MILRDFVLFAGLLVTFAAPTIQLQNEEYHEELYINPLPNGFVNTYFQFTTRWHFGERRNLHNTRLIPRPIAETLLQYDVKELHITLTQGLWRYESWGYPVVDAGMGAEVWAWFSGANLTSADVDVQWIQLASTFSGILCASLNFIDKTNSVEPKYCFRPQFADGNSKGDTPKFVRYASLPREIVCTENLTPWKKLLPCNSKEGFASLLNSGYVHNTNYHSLGIKVRTICEKPDHNCILEFTETANLVYDPKLLGNGDFSLRRLFGQGLNGYCPLAETSKIYINMNEAHRYDITPAPISLTTSTRGGATTTFGVYDMQLPQDDKLFNIAWLQRKSELPAAVMPPTPPPIYAHRYILGRGQEHGYIVTEITNNHYAPLAIVMQEHIPWFVPVYMHTLRIEAINGVGSGAGAGGGVRKLQPTSIHYIPGLQRERPYHFELALEVPARSTVQIALEFDYIFLKWLEYPPDANHGHYLGSAVLLTMLPIARNYSGIPVEGYLLADSFNASRSAYYLELHTESLLLSLPTPDFSMPYNVICLACTVVALAFGPIHSVATKRIVIEQRDGANQSRLSRLKNKIFRRKQKPEEQASNAVDLTSEPLIDGAENMDDSDSSHK